MWKNSRHFMALIGLLVLAGLACGPSLPSPGGAVETVQSAGEQAGSVAETAVALATQEGSSAVGTIQAGGQPVDLGPLQDKFESIEPDENGNFTVTVTDDEVNEAIRLNQAANEGEDSSPLTQVSLTFAGGNILLMGTVSSPVTAELTAEFRPFIANGVVQFEIVSATLGSVEVPNFILTSAVLTLNNSIGQAMNSVPSNLTLQSIVMGEGTMTISGQRQ